MVPPYNVKFRYVQALYNMLDEYTREVEASSLAPFSRTDYIYFATCFVRWLHNDYEPGQGIDDGVR